MPTIRVPLAEPLTNRDSSTTKDSKLTNCFVQNVGGQEAVIKRPGTFKQAQLSIALSQGIFSYNNVLFGITNDVMTSGPGATLVADGTDWSKTAADTSTAGSLTYYCAGSDGSYFIAGNHAYKVSLDGASITDLGALVGTDITWGGTNLIYWNGYFWNFGGYPPNNYYASVWNSVDCITWTKVTGAAPWAARSQSQVFVHNNYIYIAGGWNGADLTDVWQMTTNTGLNWTQISTTLPALSKSSNPMISYNSKIWRIPSGSTNVYSSSDDGATWSTVTTTSGLGTISQLVAYNNKIWVIDFHSPTYSLKTTVDGITFSTVLGSMAFTPSGLVEINNTLEAPSNVSTNVYSWWTALQNAPAGQNYSLTPSTANLYFDFSQAQSAAGQFGFFFKSTKDAYFFNNATLTKVTSANYPATTVPGVVYLDGTYYVGTPNGQIFGSAIEDPLTWSALNYISAETEPDTLMGIAKSLNYLVAFGQWSTEFFYDAGNATGSPLSSVPNAFFTIGCASGRSIVKTENAVVWMSQTYQRGRQIMMLNGFQPQTISTSEIDRILNADDLANVYSFSIKTNGSVFYVLTLKTSNKTLVYDFTSKQWHFWSTMVAQSPKSVTSLTYANGVVTVSQAAHGYADGDLITIAGATPSGYNGNKNITYIDSNTYSYLSASVLSSPATGTITATGYTEGYFNGTGYTYTSTDGDMIQGELDGAIYKMSPVYYDDNGVYINTKIRTVRVDGGDAKRKFNSKAEIIADKVAATALIRYTDDDYQTYCTYRPIDLSAKRSMILRLGHTRRRAYEIRVTDSQPLRFGALELDMEKGSS